MALLFRSNRIDTVALRLLVVGSLAGGLILSFGTALGQNSGGAGQGADGQPVENVTPEEAMRRFTRNLSGRNSDPGIVGRADVIDQMRTGLASTGKRSVYLLGDPGVGKTALVEQFAFEARGSFQVLELDYASLLAGAGYQGMLENRVKALVDYLRRPENRNVLLFIDEMHLSFSNKTIADILKPPMARGEIGVIGATTLAEYEQYIEKDQALVRRGHRQDVNELTGGARLAAVRASVDRLSRDHSVRISPSAVEFLVRQVEINLPDRPQIDMAKTIVDVLMARLSLESAGSIRSPELRRLEERARTIEIELRSLRDYAAHLAQGSERHQEMSSRTALLESVLGEMTGANGELTRLRAVESARSEAHRTIGEIESRIAGLSEQLGTARARNNGTEAARISGLIRQQQESLQARSAQGGPEVTEAMIAREVLRLSGVPEDQLNMSPRQRLDLLRDRLKSILPDQGDAPTSPIEVLRETLKASMTNMRPTTGTGQRPLATVALLGNALPQFANLVAENFWGDIRRVITVNGVEFAGSSETSLSRIVGAAPGYVGYDSGATISTDINRKKAVVLRLTQWDRMSSTIQEFWLKAVEEGGFRDSHHRWVSLRNAVVLLESTCTSCLSDKARSLFQVAEVRAVTRLTSRRAAAAARDALTQHLQSEHNVRLRLTPRAVALLALADIAPVIRSSSQRPLSMTGVSEEYQRLLADFVLDLSPGERLSGEITIHVGRREEGTASRASYEIFAVHRDSQGNERRSQNRVTFTPPSDTQVGNLVPADVAADIGAALRAGSAGADGTPRASDLPLSGLDAALARIRARGGANPQGPTSHVPAVAPHLAPARPGTRGR